jgi:hypothetical protein
MACGRYKLGAAGPQIEIDDAYIGGERTGEGSGRGRRGQEMGDPAPPHRPAGVSPAKILFASSTSRSGRHRLADDLQGASQGGLRRAESHLWAIFYSIKIGDFLRFRRPWRRCEVPGAGLRFRPAG